MKCLMIETKDKRRFFTHEKNFVQLIEFSKAFSAEISVVKLEQGPVLELEELVPAICDARYRKPRVRYEVIETKLDNKGKNRKEILKIARQVKKHILRKFTSRQVVSLRGLRRQFKRYNLSDPALCNHVRRVKKQLQSQGYEFVKVAGGAYRIA